ncbi:MAG: hypothetical protein IJT94_17545 [Oscillibacter sp.]|nr:hypothetical protein [Oscillibacter sp.]
MHRKARAGMTAHLTPCLTIRGLLRQTARQSRQDPVRLREYDILLPVCLMNPRHRVFLYFNLPLTMQKHVRPLPGQMSFQGLCTPVEFLLDIVLSI